MLDYLLRVLTCLRDKYVVDNEFIDKDYHTMLCKTITETADRIYIECKEGRIK